MSADRALEQARPMLEDLLPKIGIVSDGTPLDTAECMALFSKWVGEQTVGERDFAFFCSLIGAFIIVHLTEHKDAKASVRSGRIILGLPSQEGIVREFEPYVVANGIASGRDCDLESFLVNVAA